MFEVRSKSIQTANQLLKRFPKIANKALSQAVYFTADIAVDEIKRELPQHFHIRSGWVAGAIRKRAHDHLTVGVGVLSGSAFMVAQEYGGEKDAQGKDMAIPIGASSGENSSPPFRGANLMGKTLQARWPSNLKRVFTITTKAGLVLVLQRTGKRRKSVRVIYVDKKSIKIKARWNFRDRVMRISSYMVPELFFKYVARGLR